MSLHIKNVYEPATADDGVRVLVDRLWPRGLKKTEAGVERWLRDVAPSTELRKWFGHDPDRWDEFRRRYRDELREHPDALAELRALAGTHDVTLLFAARDHAHNNAVALCETLSEPPAS